MPSGLFYINYLDRFISNISSVWVVIIVTMFYSDSFLNAKSVDPDQTLHSAASELDLHCLPMYILWDARHKWVKRHQINDASDTTEQRIDKKLHQKY